MQKHYRFTAEGDQSMVSQGDKAVVSMSVGLVERQGEMVAMEFEARGGDAATAIGGCQVDADVPGAMAITITDGLGERHQLTGIPYLNIEFGLKAVGHLDKSISVELPVWMRPGLDGEGQAAVHTADYWQDASRVSRAVRASVDEAIATQCHGRGLLCHPSFVRYALRMFDGNVAWVSSPVLLMAPPQPPVVAVSNIDDVDDETCRADMHMSYNPVFELQYRVLDELPDWLMSVVAGVDVYMSAPIATYGESDEGRITRYADLVAQGPAPSGYAGHYAEASAGSPHADHWLQPSDLARQCWRLSPNGAFMSQLLECEDYYRVATLPFRELRQMSAPMRLPIAGFDTASLRKMPRLEARPNARYGGGPVVNAGGRLYSAPMRKYPMTLPALRSMMAMTGQTTDSVADAACQAWLCDEAQCCCVSASGPGVTTAATVNFPRYIYVPHNEAYCLGVQIGNSRYVLPLRRHADGKGAYWFGGFDADCAPAPVCDFSSVEGGTRPYVDISGRIVASAVGNPFVEASVSAITDSVIRWLSRVHQGLSLGQMGQFLLYAYADDGVWSLGFDKDGHCNLAQLLASGRFDAEASCETASGAALLEAGRLQLLEGTHCRVVDVPSYDSLLSSLPGLREMMSVMGVDAGAGTVQGVMRYDVLNGIIGLRVGNGWLCHDLATHAWVWQATGRGMVVTEPLVPDGAMGQVTARDVMLRGRMANADAAMALYGSNDLKHWHLLASRRHPRIDGIGGGPYRAYRVVAFCPLTSGERLDGVTLGYVKRNNK